MSGAHPAGFWIRVVALVVDFVVLAVVRASLALVARRAWGASVEDSMTLELLVVVFTLGFAALYATLLHAATGQTVGKLLVGARVVGVDGGPVPLGASLLRFFGSFVSCATLGFGYLMVALRRDKRGLHDLIAGTRVERIAARAPAPVEPSAATGPLAP